MVHSEFGKSDLKLKKNLKTHTYSIIMTCGTFVLHRAADLDRA